LFTVTVTLTILGRMGSRVLSVQSGLQIRHSQLLVLLSTTPTPIQFLVGVPPQTSIYLRVGRTVGTAKPKMILVVDAPKIKRYDVKIIIYTYFLRSPYFVVNSVMMFLIGPFIDLDTTRTHRLRKKEVHPGSKQGGRPSWMKEPKDKKYNPPRASSREKNANKDCQ